jgi:hypothetical protein
MVVTEDKVVHFTGQTKANIDLSQMVENIKWEELEDALILASSKEGILKVYASNSDAALMIYMLEQFKHNLLNGVYG